MTRTFARGLSIAAALSLALPAAFAAAAGAASSPVVAVDGGKVQGAVEDGVASWKGIPFAAAPVGPLRWRAPQPAAAWDGVRAATAYANDCMQLPFPSDAAPLGTPPSEDCLYLNVWKPTHAKARLPVLAWIYGGGFINGGSSPPTYSGANLAKQGVLVVSFNYRLGRFGFFAHPQLTTADADHGQLGNYGLMDQIAALQWVRKNIAKFGGDPANVTIIGESAGGMSVHALMTSPMADGLFAKAVIMSGGDGRTNSATLAAVEQAGVAFGVKKGIAADDREALEKLRALPADAVVDGMNLASRQGDNPPTYVGPFADGRVAVQPLDVYQAGRMKKIPVMVGATSADIGGKTGFMVGGARSVAAVLADHGLPVYEYRFSYVADSLRRPNAQGQTPQGAGHASDIPYFFDTTAIKYGDAATARDVGMGHAISAYIANFAKRGDPNGARLPAWPRYTRAQDGLMDFAMDGKPLAAKDPWAADIDAAQAAQAAKP
ncbi:carboxylesterase/lipase family protein [Massilia sp. 9096]|uniref:carboxylesterase/lipase family protein n=1 Tax=Massilia sp. 9096 TaxID=1500894 RepID=UPI00055C626C|nr:carboxylesterase family protein [Massilia sp. 9096]